jgi:hypothetical protein
LDRSSLILAERSLTAQNVVVMLRETMCLIADGLAEAQAGIVAR